MSNLETLMVLVPALPLAATLITAIFGKHVLKARSHWPTVLALVASCVCSVALLLAVRDESQRVQNPKAGWEHTIDLWTWANIEGAIAPPPAAADAMVANVMVANVADAGDSVGALPEKLPFRIDITLRADALSAVMLVMVTFIASLVAIYAGGYMHGDPGYWRFFTYISLFVFSMTMLVSASNFVLLYAFWEAVGLCSYLLIGFWFEKPAAVAAGKKAFLINRVGDFGFALGLFLIWTTYGTLNFHDAPGAAPGVLGQLRASHPELYNIVPAGVATATCLLLLMGACGKSAQFPLYVWLPDAMEGPTPVSALIHAATMVTAGVYMVARCTPLFALSANAQLAVSAVGALTAILGATIALTQTDLKRVLAYSTISQLGYMFLALGAGGFGAVVAGMFHLFTHAFFKALLFLAAGSVMHAMGGVIDVRRLGGLRRLMPTTHWTFLFGALALAGVVPFAGFWSKDAILTVVQERSHQGGAYALAYQSLLGISVLTALMTSIYTFRAFFLTFYGPQRVPHEAAGHAHESPPSMTLPLVVLALFSLGVGAAVEMRHADVSEFLGSTPSLAAAFGQATEEHGALAHLDVMITGTAAAVLGIVIAAFLYLGSASRAEWLAEHFRLLYRLSYSKLFVDQIYQVLFVWPLWLLALFSAWVDRWLIDGLVNLGGKIPREAGALLRPLQNGMVQFYALAMLLGVLALIGNMLFWP